MPGLGKFLQSWMINTLAVLVAVYALPGLHFANHSFWSPFITSLVLGILNALIRPVLMFLALPLLLVTLGLFLLVINAVVLYLTGLLLDGFFQVDSFGWAFLGALIISFVSLVLNALAGTNQTRVRVRRQRRPPPRRRGDDGPVIDV